MGFLARDPACWSRSPVGVLGVCALAEQPPWPCSLNTGSRLGPGHPQRARPLSFICDSLSSCGSHPLLGLLVSLTPPPPGLLCSESRSLAPGTCPVFLYFQSPLDYTAHFVIMFGILV